MAEVHPFPVVAKTADFTRWKCPTCGRELLVYKKGGMQLIAEGDGTAAHSGGNR